MPRRDDHHPTSTMPRWLRWFSADVRAGAALAAMAAMPLSGCDSGTESPDATLRADAGERSSTREPGDISAADRDAACDAIESFLSAGRTREAELIARKLWMPGDGDSSASPASARVAEHAARAFFARAELARAELADAERQALLELADRAAEAASRGDAGGSPGNAMHAVRLRFAALLADRRGDAARADRRYDEALAASKGNLAAELETLLHAASASIARRDLERARALVSRRVERAPDDAWSAGLQAELALAEQRPADAVAHARTAMARDREKSEFRLLLARALRADAKPADAARILSALPESERAKPAVAQQFALALGESGDLGAAAGAWNASLRANPGDPWVRAETALAYHRAGDLARAAAELDALNGMPGGVLERLRIAEILSSEPR